MGRVGWDVDAVFQFVTDANVFDEVVDDRLHAFAVLPDSNSVSQLFSFTDGGSEFKKTIAQALAIVGNEGLSPNVCQTVGIGCTGEEHSVFEKLFEIDYRLCTLAMIFESRTVVY